MLTMATRNEIKDDRNEENFVECLRKYITDNGGDPSIYINENGPGNISKEENVFYLEDWPYKDIKIPSATSELPSADMVAYRRRMKKKFLMSPQNRRIVALMKSMITSYNEKIADAEKQLAFEEIVNDSISDAE